MVVSLLGPSRNLYECRSGRRGKDGVLPSTDTPSTVYRCGRPRRKPHWQRPTALCVLGPAVRMPVVQDVRRRTGSEPTSAAVQRHMAATRLRVCPPKLNKLANFLLGPGVLSDDAAPAHFGGAPSGTGGRRSALGGAPGRPRLRCGSRANVRPHQGAGRRCVCEAFSPPPRP